MSNSILEWSGLLICYSQDLTLSLFCHCYNMKFIRRILLQSFNYECILSQSLITRYSCSDLALCHFHSSQQCGKSSDTGLICGCSHARVMLLLDAWSSWTSHGFQGSTDYNNYSSSHSELDKLRPATVNNYDNTTIKSMVLTRAYWVAVGGEWQLNKLLVLTSPIVDLSHTGKSCSSSS